MGNYRLLDFKELLDKFLAQYTLTEATLVSKQKANMNKISSLIICLLGVSLAQGWSFFTSQEETQPPVAAEPKKIIVIDPAGNSQNPGREIDDTFERSLTMQMAQDLKVYLEEKNPQIKVLLTRSPGENLEPLQNVSFSNRLGAELYISLNFFEQPEEKPSLFVYTLLLDPATDFLEKKGSELTLMPFDQTYKLSLKKTDEYAQLLTSSCKEGSKTSPLTCHRRISVPFKPLLGITAPALGIEIGIRRQNDWKKLTPVIAQALEKMVLS